MHELRSAFDDVSTRVDKNACNIDSLICELTEISLSIQQILINKQTDDFRGWKELFSEIQFLIVNAQKRELYSLSETQQFISEVIRKAERTPDSFRTKENDFLLFHYFGHLSKFPCLNLGDYIQTYAMESVLAELFPKSSFSFFDRDSLSLYKVRDTLKNKNKTQRDHFVEEGEGGGKICVMQGWFAHTWNFLPNHFIQPLWLGTHFNEAIKPFICEVLNLAPNYFTDSVGCRDFGTLKFLRDLKQDSYLSRCNTLLFPKRTNFLSGSSSPFSNVFYVDVPEHLMELFPLKMKTKFVQIKQKVTDRHWEHWTTTYLAAQSLLKKYRDEASMVVTTALHCAAPCLAMGVPVLLLAESPVENIPRFSALNGLIKCHTFEDLKMGHIDFEKIEPVHFEDLKEAMKKNLYLSVLSLQGDRSCKAELRQLRQFIEDYRTS